MGIIYAIYIVLMVSRDIYYLYQSKWAITGYLKAIKLVCRTVGCVILLCIKH